MPELAEVAFFAKEWSGALGHAVHVSRLDTTVRCFRGSMGGRSFREALDGRILRGIRTHGKRMLFEFSGDVFLGVHLGMTGRLSRRESAGDFEKHDHLVLEADGREFVFNDPRQFGRIEIWLGARELEWWDELPPQPMDKGFDFETFSAYCVRRKRSVLKSFLLIQECFPGLGNWMADEILWQARLDPRRRVESLSEKERGRLYDSIREVANGAMGCIAVDYSDPPKSWLFSHRWKAGGYCPETKAKLERVTIGGRTTCWSPTWQK